MAENIVHTIHGSTSNNDGEAAAVIHNIAVNVDGEAIDIQTALSLIDDVLMGMNCGDKDDVIGAQGKLIFLLRGLPNNVREIRLEAQRLLDVRSMLPSEAT